MAGLLVIVTAAASTSSPAIAGSAVPNHAVPAPADSPKGILLTHRHAVHLNIKDLAFAPRAIVISVGTKLTWSNQDGVEHTVTSDHGVWDSGPVNSSSTFVRVFKKAGTYTYHCTVHPFMHGTITVKK